MSESALLRAVRDRIRAHASYEDRQVQVEIDERAPATAHDIFIIVWPTSYTAGPLHEDNEGDVDRIYGVNVSVCLRSPKVPRDRQGDLLTGLTGSFTVHHRNIDAQIDKQNAVMTAANVFISAEEGAGNQGFSIPLKFSTAGSIREAPAEIFAANASTTPAALIRTLEYRGARRNEVRSNM